jgi:hypothetical protein
MRRLIVPACTVFSPGPVSSTVMGDVMDVFEDAAMTGRRLSMATLTACARSAVELASALAVVLLLFMAIQREENCTRRTESSGSVALEVLEAGEMERAKRWKREPGVAVVGRVMLASASG